MNPAAAQLLESLNAYPVVDSSSEYLEKLIAKNVNSAFGREHGLSGITDIASFRERVPSRDYDQLSPWVERAAGGERSVLTTESVQAFELTTGSSGRRKLIPWTASYQAELARALGLWMNGWLENEPSVFAGRAYWSISPNFAKAERTKGGIPIGFDGDAAYFPPDVGHALAAWLAGCDVAPGDGYFQRTIAELSDVDLSLISVWSPTFFFRLDEAFREVHGEKPWIDVWPNLVMISCWADAQSEVWRKQVEDRAGVRVEPKGLVATEGVTSFPLGERRVIGEGVHFHEFIDCVSGELYCADGLSAGREYEVVLTTGAGLWRYHTGDLICAEESGSIEFLGRTGGGCDLVGEKVTQAAVIRAFSENDVHGFIAVDEERCVYTIYSSSAGDEVLRSLKANPYFEQAVELHQIIVKREPLPHDWFQRWESYHVEKSGARIGDVKPPVLLTGDEGGKVGEWLV